MTTEFERPVRVEFDRGKNNTVYDVEYRNGDVVLLKDETGTHRLEDEDEFNKQVEEGYFEALETVTVERDGEDEESETKIDLVDVPGVGEETAENLSQAGYDTEENIEKATKASLQSIEGVGAKTVQRLKDIVGAQE